MNVVVVGAGQMGSIYGAAAHENGHNVSFIEANHAVVDRINDAGLRIDHRDDRSSLYRIPASTDSSRLNITADLVLFQTKGWATRDAATGARAVVGPETILLTLQNGLGNEEIIRSVYPSNPLLIGVSVHTVTTVGTAHYSHTGVRNTALGPSGTDAVSAARVAATVFTRADFPVSVMPEAQVRHEQWAKFVLNCGSLPTMALTRLPTDAAKNLMVVFDVMDSITRETCAIARAAGIDLDADERVAFQHELFRTAGGRASMLGDVLAKRRTEIDTINGAAVMYAERHAVPAPLNRMMVGLIKGLEKAIELGEP
ncbi:MAG: 2-dehydropantoate 2-reductase [Actinomycetota bacterium]|nr:2-dehydropantoate 2-reductase [Actinomycetota bacterium]